VASQFQNRLVGIVILVACVVIFLPSIIDGKKMAYEDEFVATPINPELKTHTLNLQIEAPSNLLANDVSQPNESINEQQDKVVDEAWQVEELSEVVKSEIVQQPVSQKVETVAKQVSVKTKMPEPAWTIQLGAFQNASNINSLLKKLHKAGYQAHTVPTEVIDGKLTRLFVGPDVSKEKLEKQLPRLKQLTKLEGKLLPFDAVNP